MSKIQHQHKSLGGISLLAILMIATVALAVIGTLEEKSSLTSTSTVSENQAQTTNTTQIGEGGLKITNTSTIAIRT